MLLTSRPESQPRLGGHPHLTRLTLNRLGREHAETIVNMLAGKPLPRDVLVHIVDRTDGVPLFLEELTKTVLEAGLLHEREDRFELRGSLPVHTIPASLHDSLLARLDRLAPVKDVAQLAACLGRDFEHAILAAVSPLPEAELVAALDRLLASELIFRRGAPPEATYSFKHSLVRDTAYESLLRSNRQHLHGHIARVLEQRFPEMAEGQPEILAYHFSEAGLCEPAISYWHKAGQRALWRGGNREAVEHFGRAIDLLRSVSETRDRDALELKIRTQLGPALSLIKGWTAPQVEAVYSRARELARRLQSSADLVPPLIGIWHFSTSSGRFDQADEVTSELFELAKTCDDPDVWLQAYHAAWPVPNFRGAFTQSYEHIQRGLQIYDPDCHRQHAFLYMGHDPGVCAHSVATLASGALGYLARARHHADAGLALARRLNHQPSLAFALWLLSLEHAARHDIAAALATAEDLAALSKEQKLIQMHAAAQILGGWATAQAGNANDGLGQAMAGLEVWNRIGLRSFLPAFTCLLAECRMAAGDLTGALQLLTDALAHGRKTGERWWEARVEQNRGRLLLCASRTAKPDAAEAFGRAIEIARAQAARSLELRAATHLAQLWAENGEKLRACELLAPVCGWFPDGFDTPDLKEAKAVLAGLG
jgi:predicted ATPase